MDDRAIEANEVIEWVKTLPEINNDNIGLWGSSQAGWVIPKIVQLNKNISFSILVAPAINWVEQGLYNTLSKMKRKGVTEEELVSRQKKFKWELSMLEKGTSYEEYIGYEDADKKITAYRWTFMQRNYKSDATEDIRHFYSPVKLFLGGKDINVDSNNTKEIYMQEVPQELLSVTIIPTGDHSMLNARLVESEFLTFLTAMFAPRQLVDKRYYDDIKEFIKEVK